MIIDSHCHLGKHLSKTGHVYFKVSVKDYKKLNKKYNVKFIPATFFKRSYDKSKKEAEKVGKIVKKNKNLFLGVAVTVDMSNPKDSIRFVDSFDQEIMKVLKPLYFGKPTPIYSEGNKEIVKHSIQKKLPIFQHCRHTDETASIQIGKLAKEFPKANIIMGHLGGSRIPYGKCFINTLGVYKKYKNVYIDVSSPFTAGCIEELVKVDPKRILFGTDYPVHYFSAHLQYVKEANISEKARQRILYKNSVKLFKL